MKEKKKEVQQPKEAEVPTASIPVEVLNSVIQYLSNKPYAEVYQLVEAIQKQSKVNQ